jgi:Mg2+ and Co2+ transporter CorA
MKIRTYDTNYSYNEAEYKDYHSDWFEVTQEEYELISKWFSVAIQRDKDYFLEEAKRKQKHFDDQKAKWEKENEARKEKAAATTLKRKQRQLEKLKAELEQNNANV